MNVNPKSPMHRSDRMKGGVASVLVNPSKGGRGLSVVPVKEAWPPHSKGGIALSSTSKRGLASTHNSPSERGVAYQQSQ